MTIVESRDYYPSQVAAEDRLRGQGFTLTTDDGIASRFPWRSSTGRISADVRYNANGFWIAYNTSGRAS